jgi:PilZ domain
MRYPFIQHKYRNFSVEGCKTVIRYIMYGYRGRGESMPDETTPKDDTREIVIIPVDKNHKPVLLTDLKIEQVDSHFRTVRELRGLRWNLQPGTYKVKVMSPSLKMQTFTLRVTPDEEVYQLVVEEIKGKGRSSPRVRVSIPVSYRNDMGDWVSTESLNLSETGICMIRRSKNLASESIYVRLFLPTSTVPLECPARICWSKEDEPKMGLELYLTPNMKASLNNWLSKQGI